MLTNIPATEDPKTGAIIHDHIYTDVEDPNHRICVTDTDIDARPILGYTAVYSAFATPKTAAKFIKANLPFIIDNI